MADANKDELVLEKLLDGSYDGDEQDALAEFERLAPRLLAVYEAAKTWCETVYVGKPHPRLPAYPGDELLHAVNAIRFGGSR